MSQTMHKVSIHGPGITEKTILPMGPVMRRRPTTKCLKDTEKNLHVN